MERSNHSWLGKQYRHKCYRAARVERAAPFLGIRLILVLCFSFFLCWRALGFLSSARSVCQVNRLRCELIARVYAHLVLVFP